MNISILSIGDEVIKGKTINTNAAFIAKELEKFNLHIKHHMVCIDNNIEIATALDFLYKESDLIITTGGLGPTIDDITKEAIANYFNEEMILEERILEHIDEIFKSMNLTTPETNKKQAYFLKGSSIIDNHNGTAPGFIYEKDKRSIIVLPGPPKELIPMFDDQVIAYLLTKIGDNKLVKKYRLMNIGESHVEEILGDLYNQFPTLKIAPYAGVGQIDYIIASKNGQDVQSFMEACQQFEDLLNEFIIGDWTKTINEIIVDELKSESLTLATAESCTGGMLASYIVDISGSSLIFNEGFVTYSNASKINRLGVSERTLSDYGAVSEEVAKEMAENIAQITHSDIGLSTTGIAGPTGGSVEKPVGLVYMGIHYKGETKVYKRKFTGNREKVRVRTTVTLLYYLYRDFIKTL